MMDKVTKFELVETITFDDCVLWGVDDSHAWDRYEVTINGHNGNPKASVLYCAETRTGVVTYGEGNVEFEDVPSALHAWCQHRANGDHDERVVVEQCR